MIKEFFLFIQNQILGMQWLHILVGDFITLLGINLDTKIGGSLQFFIYDLIKISLLLCFLIFTISYIQSYFPPERTRKILSKYHGMRANGIAALLGTVTPFCSCSSIPLFMGFTSAGLPIGVTFSFLISSPMVDLGSLLLLTSIFGAKIAIVYVIIGLILAMLGGFFIEKFKMEKYVEEYLFRKSLTVSMQAPIPTRQERMNFAKNEMLKTFNKVIPYIIVGVGIGAFIHNWIPASFIENILGGNNPLGVILATIAAIPMYADIFGAIPVAEALLAKGALLGTVIAFMMAVTTLSLPSIIMLSKIIKPPLLALFIGICTFGIILIGYFFNFFAYLFI